MALLPWTSLLWLILIAPKGVEVTRRLVERKRKQAR
jgi:hypothetical protein